MIDLYSYLEVNIKGLYKNTIDKALMQSTQYTKPLGNDLEIVEDSIYNTHGSETKPLFEGWPLELSITCESQPSLQDSRLCSWERQASFLDPD